MSNTKIDEIFPKNRPVVFFHAHCDDESFLSAGLLNELSRKKRKCVAIYGAAASVKGEEKTIIRQQQTIEACSILGISSVIFLKYSEPKYQGTNVFPLMNQKIEDVGNELLEALGKNNIKLPISLVSYDKNGGYGNKDHKVIHLVGRHLKNKYPEQIFLSEITINRDAMSNWLAGAKKRLNPDLIPQLEYWSKEFGLLNKEIEYSYKLTETQLVLKRKALAFHNFYNKPNLFPLALNDLDFKQVFGTEYLHLPTV
ncbi:MAG TPA: PIG-L family deacetylase [Patescibacteria group bacterium]